MIGGASGVGKTAADEITMMVVWLRTIDARYSFSQDMGRLETDQNGMDVP